MSSFLFDPPGPRARVRNRAIGVMTIFIAAVAIGFVIWRFSITGQFSPLKWSVFGYPRVWEQLGLATTRTLSAFAAAAVGALIVGFALAMARLSERRILRAPAILLTEIFRGVPVLILMMLVYYGLPTIGIKIPNFYAVVLALAVYNGAVIAEAIRAGVLSLPSGQREAGVALGLNSGKTLRFILLPQAVRAMMPVIIAQLVVTLKDTALGFIITYPELLYYAKSLGSNAQYGSPLIPAAIVSGAIYIGMCLLLSWAAYSVELRLRRSKKTSA